MLHVVVPPPSETVATRGVGSSEVMTAAVREIARLAAEDRRAFLFGESGVGVGWLCKWAHHTSPRSRGPLVFLLADTVPVAKLELALFGGADEPGALRRASGGTLVVRSLGELPPALQRRVLASDVDCRIVATSYSRSRDHVIMQGVDRDVLASFAGVVEVPPLRARGDDVIELAKAFWDDHARADSSSPPPLEEEHLRRFREHDWPGNVRELWNVLGIQHYRWAHGQPMDSSL